MINPRPFTKTVAQLTSSVCVRGVSGAACAVRDPQPRLPALAPAGTGTRSQRAGGAKGSAGQREGHCRRAVRPLTLSRCVWASCPRGHLICGCGYRVAQQTPPSARQHAYVSASRDSLRQQPLPKAGQTHGPHVLSPTGVSQKSNSSWPASLVFAFRSRLSFWCMGKHPRSREAASTA